MNLVIDDAIEVKQASKTDEEQRRALGKDYQICNITAKLLTFIVGQILLKGDNVSLIQALQ